MGNNHDMTSNIWNIFLKAERLMVTNCHIPCLGTFFWYQPVEKILDYSQIEMVWA